MPADYKEAIQSYFLKHLRYPDSVQISGDHKPEQGYTTAVAGAFLMREKREFGWTVRVTINAKNSQDSYADSRPTRFCSVARRSSMPACPCPGMR